MDIAVYFEEKKLFPAVVDILRAVLEDYPQITGLEEWSAETTDRTMPVLCLGKVPDPVPMTYVKAFSQKQILAFAASLTELKSSIDRLLEPPTFPPMEYEVWDTVDWSPNALAYALGGDVVVVDIETGGDIDRMLPEETWLLSLSLSAGGKCIVLTARNIRENWRALVRFLTDPKRKLIAHNMKFDFRTLTAQLGTDIKGHLDTMLLMHVINPGTKAGDYNLKGACARYLGAPDWDSGIKEYVKGNYKEIPEGYDPELVRKYGPVIAVGYENIPKHMLYEYNAYDVYWTWHLYQYLIKAAEGDPRIAGLARHEFGMSNFFQDVEKTGVAVDIPYVKRLSATFTEEFDQAVDEIRQITGEEKFNPNSPVQVKRYLTGLGFKLKSTDEKTLTKTDFSDVEEAEMFVEALFRARKASKMRGTYAEGIIKRLHGNIVYPSFLVHGTSTGRLSSRDPNIQNIPRDSEALSLRQMFIPRDVEHRSLIAVDYSQAELRVMACMSNDEYLISLFQPGMPDFFDSLMPTAYPSIKLEDLGKDEKKEYRAKLKGVIYGLSYNRKAPAIAEELKMPVRQAQSIINNYFKAAPQFYDWRQEVELIALDPTRTLISPFGRLYQAEVVTSGNKVSIVNSAMAFLPQSTASDICVTAAIEVHKWLHKYDAQIIATVHDSIMIDAPDEHVEEIKTRVSEEMLKAGYRVFDQVPFATDASHGKSWKGI